MKIKFLSHSRESHMVVYRLPAAMELSLMSTQFWAQYDDKSIKSNFVQNTFH